MGRVYDTLRSDGVELWTIFDTGAVQSYVIRSAARDLAVLPLRVPYEVGLGGETRRLSEACLLQGELGGYPLYAIALIVESLGEDESGREIEVLLGAEAMETWNIRVDPKARSLDLSRFRTEFVEY